MELLRPGLSGFHSSIDPAQSCLSLLGGGLSFVCGRHRLIRDLAANVLPGFKPIFRNAAIQLIESNSGFAFVSVVTLQAEVGDERPHGRLKRSPHLLLRREFIRQNSRARC